MRRDTAYNPDPDDVAVRDLQDDGQLYTLTAPISSDQMARDGMTFSREKLKAFRDQINGDGQPVPLMVDHGKSDLGGGARYSVLGRVGTVDSAELTRDGGATLLEAEMSVADPDALADEGDAGEIEAALRYLKYQAEAMGLSFSVGWDEDSDRTEGPSLLEVSCVAIPSDVAASTAGVKPSEAATRGFESLPARAGGEWPHNMPDDWGMRGHEPPEPTDVERAADALAQLEHVREFHTQDPMSPGWNRSGTPAPLEAIDSVRDQLGDDDPGVDLEERIDAFDDDGYNPGQVPDELASALDEVEETAEELAQPSVKLTSSKRYVQYPFGRSRSDSRDRIRDAVNTLREVVLEDDGDDTSAGGWGMAALLKEVDD